MLGEGESRKAKEWRSLLMAGGNGRTAAKGSPAHRTAAVRTAAIIAALCIIVHAPCPPNWLQSKSCICSACAPCS